MRGGAGLEINIGRLNRTDKQFEMANLPELFFADTIASLTSAREWRKENMGG